MEELIKCSRCDIKIPNDRFPLLGLNEYVSKIEQHVCGKCLTSGRMGRKLLRLARKLTTTETPHISTLKQFRYALEQNHQNTKTYSSHRNKLTHRLKISFGITVEDFEAFFRQQNFCCAICGKSFPENLLDTLSAKQKFPLVVDHDHVTGKIRGLLCSNHNSGLGLFEDNALLLRKAATYLDRTKPLRTQDLFIRSKKQEAELRDLRLAQRKDAFRDHIPVKYI